MVEKELFFTSFEITLVAIYLPFGAPSNPNSERLSNAKIGFQEPETPVTSINLLFW